MACPRSRATSQSSAAAREHQNRISNPDCKHVVALLFHSREIKRRDDRQCHVTTEERTYGTVFGRYAALKDLLRAAGTARSRRCLSGQLPVQHSNAYQKSVGARTLTGLRSTLCWRQSREKPCLCQTTSRPHWGRLTPLASFVLLAAPLLR